MYKIFIDGREGTTGLKIYERLKMRSDIKLLEIDDALRKDINERKKLITQSDITFLCLPDVAAIESFEVSKDSSARIIDASTAHRTLDDWAYGLPEVNGFRKKIKNSKNVCVPGCHASGAIALIRPLIENGYVSPYYPFVIGSITGYSGGGKKMIEEYENIDTNQSLNSPRQYALTQNHKHLPEITKYALLDTKPIFIPQVANFYSGMSVSVPILPRFMSKKADINTIKQCYLEYYDRHSTISLSNNQDEFLPANKLSTSDYMQIYVNGCDERIVLTAVYDNLGKGASGAAIQCMNIMLGVDEHTSLNK